ncbi:potassium channel subfamily K member 2-like [Branchiostoma lanceolatum]|uniref:potassium channel subfamily K member 2-like n=1 Tax=Branchiostoma lanceolatum TaxID=7740 RepID=UPI00345600B0
MKKTTLLVLAVVFTGYLFIGGGVFHVLEFPHEEKIREKTFKIHQQQDELYERLFDHDFFGNRTRHATDNPDHLLRQDVVTVLVKRVKEYLDETYRNLTWETHEQSGNTTNMTQSMIRLEHVPTMVLSQHQLEDIIHTVWEASKSGLHPFSSDEADSSPPHWDFLPSVTFSMTVVTTIGYGVHPPRTTGGRVFVIFYALLGIPLTAAFLSGLAGVMGNMVRRVTNAIQKCHKKCPPARASYLAWALCLFVGIGVFFVLPALVVHHVENWSFVDSVYFMFVSLSTIGFGDFVAGIEKKKYWEGYRILMKVWIVVGLAFLATIFDIISQAIKKVEDKIEEETAAEEDTSEGEKTGDDNLGRDVGDTEKQSDGNSKDQNLQTKEEAIEGTVTPLARHRQGSTRRPRVPLIMIVDNPATGRQARQHVWQM